MSFTVTFDQFNACLLIKSIDFFQQQQQKTNKKKPVETPIAQYKKNSSQWKLPIMIEKQTCVCTCNPLCVVVIILSSANKPHWLFFVYCIYAWLPFAHSCQQIETSYVSRWAHLVYHTGDGNCPTVPSTSALLPAHMSEMWAAGSILPCWK